MKLKEIQRKGWEKFYESCIEKEINPSLRNRLKIAGYACLSLLTFSGFYGYNIVKNNNVVEIQKIDESATKSLLEKGYSLEQIEGKSDERKDS